MIKDKKTYRKSDSCLNCGRELGDFNFCPDCGQINTHKQITLTQIIKDLLGEYFTFDSKFFRSFVPLIKKPGHLTTEYIGGKRATYILPMRLFVFTTALFFFILALTNQDETMSDFQNNKILNPEDTLNAVFEAHNQQLPDELQAIIIDEITTRYDLYSTNRSFSKIQLKLNREIDKYNLKISQTEKEYFVLELIKNFRLRNMKNTFTDYDYMGIDPDSLSSVIIEQTKKNEAEFDKNFLKTPKKKNKQNPKILDSLKTYIVKNCPKGLNKNDRFFNYIKDNHTIFYATKRKNNPNFTFFGQDSSKSEFVKKIEKNGQKMAESGALGQKIFLLQFMNHMPKLVFFMVPFLAFLLKIFYIRSRIYYINHVIFSLHLHSVMLIILLFPLFFSYLNFGGTVVSITTFIILIGFYFYSFKALKKVYRQKGLKTFIKINTIIFIYLITFVIGLSAAALYTLYTI